jgi:curved DNA-binding protein CbpA
MDVVHAAELEGRGRWFELLGLPDGADEQQVRRACREVRVRYHPDRSSAPVLLAQIMNHAADRLTRLLLEPLRLFAKHSPSFTPPPWVDEFEGELRRAREARDSEAFERSFARYRQRVERLAEEEEGARIRSAQEDVQRVRGRRALLRRLRYPLKRGTQERAAARVELAVQRSAFPRITPRFLREHPEKAAAIRQLSRQYERARSASRYRQQDREHQATLLAQRERLLREAWGYL